MTVIQKAGLLLLILSFVMFLLGIAGFSGEFSGDILNEIAKNSFFLWSPAGILGFLLLVFGRDRKS